MYGPSSRTSLSEQIPRSRTPQCIPEEHSPLDRSYVFHKFPSSFAQVRVFSRAPAGQRPHEGNALLTTPKSCWSVRPISWSFCRTRHKKPAEGGPLKPTTSRRRSEASRRERIFALLSHQRAWLNGPCQAGTRGISVRIMKDPCTGVIHHPRFAQLSEISTRPGPFDPRNVT